MKPITGQLIFREVSGGTHGSRPKAKRLMMVVGIFAVPESTEIKGEHQYTVSGALCEDRVIQLNIDTRSKIDQSAVTVGSSFGHLVRQPIWRV